MRKIVKIAFCFSLILLFSVFLTACKDHQQETAKIKIGDIEYQTLTEAVQSAKSGDTIKIYDDVFDNKNIVIDKPISIEGVLKEGQIKPKFYGSLTVNSSGQNDSISVKDIEIIHSGTKENSDSIVNDTSIGLNLVDGGLDLKSSSIMLDKSSKTSQPSSGLILSRKINSQNIMPIIVEGNSFGFYTANGNNLSSALIIKSNDENLFKNIVLNENEIFNNNTFSTQGEGNQIISINYSSSPETYSYMVTSSMNNLVDSLKNNQPSSHATYFIFPSNSLSEKTSSPIKINNRTLLIIDGTKDADFKNSEIELNGTMIVDGKIKNAKILRNSPTAYISIKNTDQASNVEILNS